MNRIPNSSGSRLPHYPRAIGFFDISGSTTLWHEARGRDHQANAKHLDRPAGENQAFLTDVLGQFLNQARERAAKAKLIFINTTGDGFVVASHSTFWSQDGPNQPDPNYHPCQVLYEYYGDVAQYFDREVAPNLQRRYVSVRPIFLRAGLHYGRVYFLGSRTDALFFGDSLNVAARILNSDTARNGSPASSFVFFSRFHRLGWGPHEVDTKEIIKDKNCYPEPIEIYDLHDAKAAQFQIERVRNYPKSELDRLQRLIHDPLQVRQTLGLRDAELISNSVDGSKTSYHYRPPRIQKQTATTVELCLEVNNQPKFSWNVRLRVTHKGFDDASRTSWVREIGLWNERLRRIDKDGAEEPSIASESTGAVVRTS